MFLTSFVIVTSQFVNWLYNSRYYLLCFVTLIYDKFIHYFILHIDNNLSGDLNASNFKETRIRTMASKY